MKPTRPDQQAPATNQSAAPKHPWGANAMLLLTALIWGSAFVAQRVGMDSVDPFTFNALRNILAALALLPVIFLMSRRAGTPAPSAQRRRNTCIGGLLCGAVLFAASALQQFGIVETDAGKAGFITALYIVIVPLLGLFLGRRMPLLRWVSVGVASVGLYLLCVREGLTIWRGDLLLLACAFLFGLHILLVDTFAPRADALRMSCIQFLTAGALSLVCMFALEAPTWPAILESITSILYAGLLSSGVGYTLQIVAQRHTNPIVASLLMSLEAVFAALAGWLLLGETLTLREIMGATLMFGAILLTQLAPQTRAERSAHP